MSQKLCEDCLKWFVDQGFNTGNPVLHCHHEEEKKGCERCGFGSIGTMFYLIPTNMGPTKEKAKCCPECGRRL